ncbi:MAG: saccharopine dehydrogenase, partial [Pseudomonadota bacterium]|nr:saccharopine dehydrogenase [Pseudomonadota bacterium]
ERMLPKPGEGPTKKQRENGFFKILMVGLIDKNNLIKIEITGDQDPGYGSTSKMLSETAICLACDNINIKGGHWTPASALGEKLLDRLESKAGMKFKILEKE